MRLAPGSQDRSQLRMPPSLAQVVAMLQGGNTTNIIIGVLIVLVLVQVRIFGLSGDQTTYYIL